MDEARDYENKKGSSKNLTDFEVSNNGVVEPHSNKSEDSVSSSSSSSTSSPLSSSSSSEVLPGEDVIEVSQKSQSSGPISSADKSNGHLLPQNQLIGSTDYDPNRIPSSVFASKPATPLEWSVASNESLFSIPVGNGSFSRDQFFMFYKSGELYKFDEMMNPPVPSLSAPPPSPAPAPAPAQPPTPPPSPSPAPPPNPSQLPATSPTPNESKETEMKPQNRDSEETKMGEGKSTPTSTETEVTSDKKSAVVSIETDQQPHSTGEKKATATAEARHSSSISCRSDGSNNSTCSFAFPVLPEHNDQSKYSSNMNAGFNMGRQHSPRPQHHQDQQSPELAANRAQSQGQSQDLQSQTPTTSPKAAGGCFSCFYCCSSLRC